MKTGAKGPRASASPVFRTAAMQVSHGRRPSPGGQRGDRKGLHSTTSASVLRGRDIVGERYIWAAPDDDEGRPVCASCPFATGCLKKGGPAPTALRPRRLRRYSMPRARGVFLSDTWLGRAYLCVSVGRPRGEMCFPPAQGRTHRPTDPPRPWGARSKRHGCHRSLRPSSQDSL